MTEPAASRLSETNVLSEPAPAPVRKTARPAGGLPARRPRGRKRLLLLAAVAVVLAGGGWAAWAKYGKSGGTTAGAATYAIEVASKKPFKLNVVEKGTVASLKSVSIVSKVEGTTTIISIVPSGTKVKEGDLLVELDASKLVETEKAQVIAVTQAEAALTKATESLEIQKRQNESDIAAAQLALDLAVLDLEKFKSGDFPQQQAELGGTVKVADQNLQQAQEVYAFSQRLSTKGFISQSQLEKDRIAVLKAEIDKKAAEEKLKVLEEFTFKRTVKELEDKQKEAVRARERVERQGIATLAQLKADLEAARLTLQVEKEKLERAQTQIAASKITAPQSGEVVYAASDDRRSDAQVIAEGATVRERQKIIELPALDQMKVDTRIHESLISRIREGLPARIRVDAIPGKIFTGRVVTVSSVPVEGNWMRPDLKEYSCVVGIDYKPGEDTPLKPGLTASVEIVVQEREGVLQIPFQSVVTAGKKKFTYVLTPDGPQRRELSVGASNDTHYEILDGVKEGERVILNPRSRFAEEIAALDAAESAKAEAEAPGAAVGGVQAEAQDAAAAGAAPGGAPPAGGPAPGGPQAGPGGPQAGPGGPGGPGGGPGGGQRRDPGAFFARLDKNGDGSVTEDEMPEFLASRFGDMDKNSDGKVDKAEFTEAAASFRPPGGGAGGPGGPGGFGGGAGGQR